MSFAASVKERPGGMKIFASSFSKASQSLAVYMLITGNNEGRPAWYYVSVERLKYPLLKKRCEEQSLDIDLNEYGQILYSGWGSEPSPYIKAEMQKKYNFS